MTLSALLIFGIDCEFIRDLSKNSALTGRLSRFNTGAESRTATAKRTFT